MDIVCILGVSVFFIIFINGNFNIEGGGIQRIFHPQLGREDPMIFSSEFGGGRGISPGEIEYL